MNFSKISFMFRTLRKPFSINKVCLIVIVFLFYLPSYADETVVARVNGAAITSRDIEEEIDRLIPRITFHRNVSEEKRKNFRGRALEELINRELQYQDAITEGLKADEEQVKNQMEQFKNRYKSREGYEEALKKMGITENELRARIEKDLLLKTAISKIVIQPAQMSEEALKEYYDKNPNKFKKPESVRLRLISTKDEEKAKEILNRIKAGEDFTELASKMSEDVYRIKGGDIGYIHKGRIIPEIEDVAFKLEVGQVSNLIKAGENWSIVKVEDKKPEQQMSFEEIKERLKKELEARRAKEIMDKWISDLRAKAKIEILPIETGAPAK
ncbi:MAG: peptidyl-prolyl cis-trans isomerase [Nitrospirota bacterium]